MNQLLKLIQFSVFPTLMNSSVQPGLLVQKAFIANQRINCYPADRLAQVVERRTAVREVKGLSETDTHGLKITEESVPPF